MKKGMVAITLAALLLSLFSCVYEEEIGGTTPTTNKEAQVLLRLKTPSGYSPSVSRSLSYADENTISNVYVLVFDNTSTLVGIVEGTSVSSSAGSTNSSYSGEGSFSVTLDPSKTSDDTYKLVVLANAQSIIGGTIGFDVSSISNKGYADVMGTISAQISGPMFATGGTIPMSGESGLLLVEPGNSTQTIQLTRCVARIDVGVGNASKESTTDAWTWDGKDTANENIPFVLGHVYVIKPNNRYAVPPDATLLGAGKATVPTGTTAFSFDESKEKFVFAATVSDAGGYILRDIYVPEADIEIGTSASAGDDNHTNRMAIVVGGYYNGNDTETFYRLDFAVNGTLINVLRNHLYQFNISSVSGDGYPDVETAYEARAMNMTVNISEWDEAGMNHVAFDGQYILSVSDNEFTLPKEAVSGELANGSNVLYIQTDYPGGWQVEKIVDAADGITPVTRVSLSTTSGEAGSKAEVAITTEANACEERNAVVWITAGRLRFAVRVTQEELPPMYLGMFGGELKETNGVWQFERPLYGQSRDESTKEWKTTQTFTTGAYSDWDGKANSLAMNDADHPPAYSCMKKNTGSINTVNDENFIWYLPAQKQLMAASVVKNSFSDLFDSSSALSYYWSSTQISTDPKFALMESLRYGYTYSSYKTDKFRVLCVKEVK